MTGPRSSGSWAALAATAGAQFLAVLSTTMISVALPAIGTALDAGPADLQWVVDAFVLVYASLLVTGGTLGDRWGRKGVFLCGLLAFGLGSLLAGLATTVPVLVAGRLLQGLGPALIVPVSLTIIRMAFPEERRRALAIGLWSTCSGLGMAAGPVVGGLIVDGLGWRWVLLINVPLTAALALLAARVVPAMPRAPSRHRLDWQGALLTTAGVAALAFALIEGQRLGFTSPVTAGVGAAGLALLVAFVFWELRRPEPLVDLTLFRRAPFAVANLAGLLVFFAFIGLIVYLSAYFQQVRGLSPGDAGLNVAVIGAGFALGAPVSGRLVGRYGPRPPMVAGMVLGGAATLGLLRLDTTTGFGEVWWCFALGGFGIGMCLTPLTATAVSAVDAARAGMASAVHSALRQFGQVLGVAVLGGLTYAHLPDHGSGHLGAHEQDLFVTGLHNALLVAGLALLGTAVLAVALVPRRPRPRPLVPSSVPGVTSPSAGTRPRS